MQPIAVVPLLGNTHTTEEERWLGVALAHLLADHLATVVDVVPVNEAVQDINQSGVNLPLEQDVVSKLRHTLNARVVVHGRYTLGKTLGLTLFAAGDGLLRAPLEAAAPLQSFSSYIERVTLALLDRLGEPITDEVRTLVKNTPRPTSFEAFQQVARARLAWARGENELALAAVEAALTFDDAYEDAIAIQIAIARDAGDTETVKGAFQKWAELAKKRGQTGLAAERYILAGHWLIERTEWDDARRVYRQAAEIFRRQKDEVGEARARCNLAMLDITIGNPGPSIAVLRRSLRVFEEDENARQDAAQAYFNLALAHKQQGQREEAVRALEEAIKLAREVGDNRLQARIVAQRGTIRDDMGQWAEAMSDYARAANLLDALGDEGGKAIVRGHQALLYRQQGMYERAETIFLEALGTLDGLEHPPPHDQAILWLNLADLYYATADYDQAWEFAGRANETFEAVNSSYAAAAARLIAALEEIPDEPSEDSTLPTEGLQPPPTPEA